jgi:hypothetical protein
MIAPADLGDVELRRRLRALRVEPEDAGFAQALHRRLVEVGPPRPARLSQLRSAMRRVLWPAAGLAAGVAAYALLAVVRGPAPSDEAVVRVPETQVALVHLTLSADAAVASADIRVTLPDGLAFWVDGRALAERAFEWQQPLTAGDNEIPIAIRGQRPGRYHLTVSARAGAERIEHDVLLEVTGT